jgi:hypothetical protein
MTSGRVARGARWFFPIAIALAIAIFYRRLLSGHYIWYDGGGDIVWQVIPWMQVQISALRSGQFALWDPWQVGGQPLLGQLQPGILNPLNYLLILPSLVTGHVALRAFSGHFVVLHILAALALFLMARGLGVSAPASSIAALFYGIGGVTGNAGWPQVVSSMVFPPLIFLFLLKATSGVRPLPNAAMAGLLLGVSWYAGHHAAPILITTAVAAFLLLRILRLTTWRRTVADAAVCLGIAGLVALPQVWASWEFALHSMRYVGLPDPVPGSASIPWAAATVFSVSPRDLGQVLFSKALSGKSPFDGWLFCGVVISTLAILGASRALRDEKARIFLALSTVSLLFAFGRYTPVHHILYAGVPLLSRLREPVFALIPFQLGVAGLAALGADLVFAKGGWKRYTVLGGCVVLLLVEHSFVSGQTPQTLYVRVGQSRMLGSLSIANSLGKALAGNGINRVDVNRDTIPLNLGDYEGIPEFTAYLPALDAPIVNLHSWRPAVRRLYGVNFLADYIGEDLQLTQFPNALARAWTVHSFVSLPATTDMSTLLEKPPIDPATTAVLSGELPAVSSCPGDERARITQYRLNSLTIETDLNCRGMVVLSDNYYPGWKATVDGESTRIMQPYFALRGVMVDKGRHEIRMVYRPDYLFIGGWFAIVGIAMTVALWIVDRRVPTLLA